MSEITGRFEEDLAKIIDFLEVQRHQHTVMFDGLTSLITLLNAYKGVLDGGANADHSS
jgi:hypothetical protein